MLCTDTDMPEDGWWHVTQARPLVPIGSKNGCPFVSKDPDVLSTPSSPWSFSYVAYSGSGVPCPGLHHDVDGPGAAATNTAESHSARSIEDDLFIGTLLSCSSATECAEKFAQPSRLAFRGDAGISHGTDYGTNYGTSGDGKAPPVAPMPNTWLRLGLLFDWVERGAAPGMSVTVAAGEKSLPLCSYPSYPRHVTGRVASASSYRCNQP